jgi:survival-of-motor-neuron-related-splicing factor 30
VFFLVVIGEYLHLTTDVAQLETVQSSLQVDPDNAELQSLKTELEEFISLTEASIAELKPPAAPGPSKDSSPPPKEKWSKEKHPAYQAGYRKPEAPPAEEPSAPVSFSVNDNVTARWVSGDNAFYPARITSITGSSSNPVYIVSFKSYGTTETLTAKDIRPISSNGDSRKRKADGTPGTSSQAAASLAHSSVISAAADINPALANEARKEPSKVSDGPTRPAKVARKVKATRELEAGKSKWQDFTSKSKFGKTAKKESMFRTPDGVNARGPYFISSFVSSRFTDVWFSSGLYWFRPGDAQGSGA